MSDVGSAASRSSGGIDAIPSSKPCALKSYSLNSRSNLEQVLATSSKTQTLDREQEAADHKHLTTLMVEHFQKQETMLRKILQELELFSSSNSNLVQAHARELAGNLPDDTKSVEVSGVALSDTGDTDTIISFRSDESGNGVCHPGVSGESGLSHELQLRTQMTMGGQDSMHHRAHADRASMISAVGRTTTTSGTGRSTFSFIEDRRVNAFFLALIIVNVVLVGVEVDITARVPSSQIPKGFMIANIIFVAVFLGEISLVWLNRGTARFLCGLGSAWNIFDIIIIFMSLVELGIDLIISGLESAENVQVAHLRIFRLLRVMRALRGVKVLRVLRFVASLRTLIHSILNTLSSLLWTLVLLMLLFYGFGVALTQLTSDHCRALAMEMTGDVDADPTCGAAYSGKPFGNLPESMLTLFLCISGGVSYNDVLEPLREVSWLAVALFLVYIFFTVFSVLNVVTGYFCHAAIESVSQNKDVASMIQMNNQKLFVANVRAVFQEMNVDSDDVITIDEFERALNDDRLCAYLESIDLPTSDAWTLFRVIDSDKSGTVELDEFVDACFQLRGPAKAIQLAKMSLENSATRRTILELEDSVASMKKALAKTILV